MTRALVLTLVALVGCDSGQAAPMNGGLGGLGGGPAEGDGGHLLTDAQLTGFADSGRDSGTDGAAGFDAFVPDSATALDAGRDAGPCYPPEGLSASLPLECDVCPSYGCLPIIWKHSMAAGGFQGVVSAKLTIKDDQDRSLVRTLYPSDDVQSELFVDGPFLESYRGQELMGVIDLELDADPWSYTGMSALMQGSSAIPSYLRIVAHVTAQGAVVAWTMHRAPD